jgi:hypothetical protein
MLQVPLEEPKWSNGYLCSHGPVWGAAGIWLKLRQEGKMLSRADAGCRNGRVGVRVGG